jgi:phytoene desaturase
MSNVEHIPGSADMSTDVVVIGGGFGGIASALRCRALGMSVLLIERLDEIGGRAQVFKKDGFTHDAGPTVITAPFLFTELYELFDEDIDDHLIFKHLEPWYRFYFHDGRNFDYGHDLDKMKQQIAQFSPADVDGYDKLVSHSHEIFNVGFTELADKPFHKFLTMVRQIPALLKLGAYRTVSQMVAKYIKHPLLRRALSIQPLLVGGNPFTTTSIYSLIHYLEREWGIHFCMGGTGKLVSEMRKLMERQGVDILTGQDVGQITLEGDRVNAVHLSDGRVIQANHVICNADPPTVYREMLDRSSPYATKPKRIIPESMTQYSMGLFVLYFGTTKQYPDIAHHTIWLSERFKELLHDIFTADQLSEDFSLYLHRPTATDPSFAPEGCDSFYVLCPVPNLQATNIDWERDGPLLRDQIVKALSDTIMPELEQTITADFYMTPQEFKQDYRSTHGAGFSIAPIFRQSAWFRYHNQDPHIDNLYFVGAGTHPGAGVPGVLSSAKVVESIIREKIIKLREVA